MRLVAEYIENTAQLLIRFLSIPSIEGDIVQLGTYSIDGTPQIPCVVNINIGSDDIKNGEAHAYLVGYWPLPKYLDVTLPDLTAQKVQVVQVVQHSTYWEPFIMEQPIEAIKPIEQDLLRPSEGYNPYTPEAVRPPEYPDSYIELFFERTEPVKLGADMTSSPITYVGGCEGRALSSTIKQTQTDAPPYLAYAPLRLEGQFSNTLYNSNFSLSPSWDSPHFDPLPDGWMVNLVDPMSSVRMEISEPDTTLPTFTLRYRPRADSDVSSIPPVTILTPALTNNNEVFQVILYAGANNTRGGRVQLKTEDNSVSSTFTLVEGSAIIAHLPISTHIGRIQLLWDQPKGENTEQILQLIAPSASIYTGAHSYIPTGKTSFADVVTIDNILFNKPWYLYKGSIRIDGSGEVSSQPYSWTIKIGSQILLRVAEGVLSSDFMLQPSVTLSSYLSNVLSYKLKWTSLTSFKLSDVNDSNLVDIPFSLDLASIVGSDDPMSVEIMGYKPNEGSSIATRWAYSLT